MLVFVLAYEYDIYEFIQNLLCFHLLFWDSFLEAQLKCCAEENVKNFENWFFETFVAEKFLRVLAGKSALKVLFRCLSLGFVNLCKGMVLGPSEEGVGNKKCLQIRFLQSSTPTMLSFWPKTA